MSSAMPWSWPPPVLLHTTENTAESESPEDVEDRVGQLLDNLSLENCKSIADELLGVVTLRHVPEQQARTLALVISVVLERAIDEPPHCNVYFRLCEAMANLCELQNVAHGAVTDRSGRPLAGRILFATCISGLCRQYWQLEWAQNRTASMEMAISKEMNQYPIPDDQDYLAEETKRRRLGLVKFTAELYTVFLIIPPMMTECLETMVGQGNDITDGDVECICLLLMAFDEKARANLKREMAGYIVRLEKMSESSKISSPMRLMLQDTLVIYQSRAESDKYTPVRGNSRVVPKKKHNPAADRVGAALWRKEAFDDGDAGAMQWLRENKSSMATRPDFDLPPSLKGVVNPSSRMEGQFRRRIFGLAVAARRPGQANERVAVWLEGVKEERGGQ